MGIENIAKSAGQSFTGGIEKAIIEIERHIPTDINVTDVKAGKSLTTNLSQISDKLSQQANNVANSASSEESIIKKWVTATQESIAKGAPTKKRFAVKFNPSQITFQGVGGGKVEKRDYEVKHKDPGKNVDISYQEMQPRIQMNLQLIFDDYERTQAFMSEKFTDASAAARTVVTGIANAVTGRTYSVRPQVEGFIGALINPFTRKISFYWGKMKYQGVLNSVNAEYTMFSTDGNPIRANVNIGILLVDETLDYQSMGPWQYSYLTVFGKDNQTELGSAVQNVGNLFNINL